MATEPAEVLAAWKTLLAGGCAGAGVDAVLFPLDTIKTRLQAARLGQTLPAAGSYAGLGVNTVGSFVSSGVFFAVYERTKKELAQAVPGMWAPATHMSAAAIADVFAVGARVPFELLKQQLQAGQHKRTRDAVAHVYRTQGMRGFFTGYWSTLMREIPFDAIEFALYESMRAAYLEASGRSVPSGPMSLVIGAVAGGVAAALTNPLDVVKTRVMTDTTGLYGTGTLAAARRMYAEEGMAVFARGVAPRVMWISAGGAIFFGVYERVKQVLL